MTSVGNRDSEREYSPGSGDWWHNQKMRVEARLSEEDGEEETDILKEEEILKGKNTRKMLKSEH